MTTTIPHYTGWRPREMRRRGVKRGAGDSSMQRNAKRTRLGPRKDQIIYISAKGWKHQDYAKICKRSDSLNHVNRVPIQPKE